MDGNISNLWSAIYEIEGLVLLIDKKGDNIPEDLMLLLKNKTIALQELIEQISSVETQSIDRESDDLPIILESQSGTDDDSVPDALEQQASIEADVKIDEEDNFNCNEFDDFTEGISDEHETIEDFSNDELSMEINDDEIGDFDDVISDAELEDIDDSGDISVFDSEKENAATTITLDEKLARQNSRNLKLAFTINDRYRFRRELFGNSDTEFADTINLVSAMSSLQEAEEYFYGDLEWDASNEEVRDFMTIIAHYFANL